MATVFAANLAPYLESVPDRHRGPNVVIVITDGLPGEPTALERSISSATRRGTGVIGLVLDLAGAERDGMLAIFGQRGVCLTAGRDMVERLSEVVAGAITRFP